MGQYARLCPHIMNTSLSQACQSPSWFSLSRLLYPPSTAGCLVLPLWTIPKLKAETQHPLLWEARRQEKIADDHRFRNHD